MDGWTKFDGKNKIKIMILDWYSITIQALQGLWQAFLNFIPVLIGAFIVFVVGWFVSAGVGRLVAGILKRVKFNHFFERGSWRETLKKAEIKVDAAGFIGAVVKWVLVIVFLLAAVDILGLEGFANFLGGVLAYLPNVVVAVLIFVVTVIVVDIVEKLVRAAVEGVKIGYGQFVSAIVRWAIWIFAILAILRQLLVVPELVEIVFGALVYGVVAFLVISIGIAFGLGGKEVAAELLQDLKRKLKKEE